MKSQGTGGCDDGVVPSFPPPTVLIADPDAETRALYRDAFIGAGCAVVEAVDGRDALAKALPHPPSLVVTELTLPFVNGHALCDILRRDPVTAAVPILVVTSAHTAEPADGIHVDALLRKPTAPDSLVREAQRLLAASLARKPASAVPRSITTRPGTADAMALTNRPVSDSKTPQRFTTGSPPKSPPVLSCPSCDRTLKYEQSHLGGVSARHAEQWDYFVCRAGCGKFQYRHRTRRVRRVD